MKRIGTRILSIVLAAGLAPALLAESHEEPAAPQVPPLFFIWTDYVELADTTAYEAETRKVLAKMAETEEGKKLRYLAIQGPTGYAYVIQLAGMEEFWQKSQQFMAAIDSVGGMGVWDAANAMVTHGSGTFIILRPELSYTPAEPRAEEETGQFRLHEWWYVKPGHDNAIEDVARRLVALYAEKGIDTGWRVYQALTGDDLPLYVVANTAADVADYHANEARIRAELGEAAQKLLQEAMTHTRRVERTPGTVRPDLSMGM